jgi:uncharacterized phage-associated protein
MITAIEVAKYIIKSLPVDNLKLQKLLYYSQAVHLVMYDKKPLFPEAIEAWDYCPVVPPVYHEYKTFGIDTITRLIEEKTPLSIEEKKAVDMALECFGSLPSSALVTQTHYEAPWENAYRPGRPSGIITVEAIYDYFKDVLDFSDEK